MFFKNYIFFLNVDYVVVIWDEVIYFIVSCYCLVEICFVEDYFW